MNRATSATGWVRNPDGTPGYTWNPITGCRNHTGGLCKGGGFPCYAHRLANGRLKERYLANLNIALPHENPKEAFNDSFYPRFWESRLWEFHKGDYDKAYPTRIAYNASREIVKGIFVCDMSDLFGIGIPEDWTRQVMERIKALSQHRFYLLTKQPQNLAKFSPFPDNCWVGVTATDRFAFIHAQVCLAEIKAKVKYISFEPLLAPIDPESIEVDWVIIGAQTKPYKPPKIEWVREVAGACDKAGVPVFLKDNLYPLIHKESIVADRGKLRIGSSTELRQEIPE